MVNLDNLEFSPQDCKVEGENSFIQVLLWLSNMLWEVVSMCVHTHSHTHTQAHARTHTKLQILKKVYI